MIQCEETEEGVHPSETPLCGKHDDSQTEAQSPKDSGESLSSDSVDDTTDDSDSPDSSDSGHSSGSSCVSSASKKSKEGIIHFKKSPKDSGESFSSDSVDDTTDDSDSPDSSDSGLVQQQSFISHLALMKLTIVLLFMLIHWLKFKKKVSRPDDLESSDRGVSMDSQDSSENDSSSEDRDTDF